MVKFNRKTLFEQWLSPFNQQLFEEQAKTFQLNDALQPLIPNYDYMHAYCTKKYVVNLLHQLLTQFEGDCAFAFLFKL